jgi:hypothetical protein
VSQYGSITLLLGAISLLIARSLIAAKCIEWDDNASSALLFSFDIAQWSSA